MTIADPEQRQTGGPENILCFELCYRCTFQLLQMGGGDLFIVQQGQIRQSCRIVLFFGFAQPLDFNFLRHVGDCLRLPANMTIKEAREMLGEAAAPMTDKQMQELMDSMTALVDIVVDAFKNLPPEERAKYRKQP